jgi:hypothetical protein
MITDQPRDDDTDEEDSPEERIFFTYVDTKTIQAIIYDIASNERTPDDRRKSLYEIHKKYSFVTKIPFVESKFDVFELISQPTSMTSLHHILGESTHNSMEIMERESKMEIETQAHDSEQNHLNGKKKKMMMKTADSEPSNSTVHTSKKRKNDTEQHDYVGHSDSHDYDGTHVASLDDTEALKPFISSRKFEGAKAGYVFKKVRRLISCFLFDSDL